MSLLHYGWYVEPRGEETTKTPTNHFDVAGYRDLVRRLFSVCPRAVTRLSHGCHTAVTRLSRAGRACKWPTTAVGPITGLVVVTRLSRAESACTWPVTAVGPITGFSYKLCGQRRRQHLVRHCLYYCCCCYCCCWCCWWCWWWCWWC